MTAEKLRLEDGAEAQPRLGDTSHPALQQSQEGIQHSSAHPAFM